MLRVLTAGESHGPELVAIMEGLPAGVPISRAAIQADLARRKLGYGRGSRMKFEEDELSISGGVRARHEPRQPDRPAHRQHRVAQVGRGHEPRARRAHREVPRPRRRAHAPASRPRRPRRHAEVRLRRGPADPRARERPRDGRPRRARRTRTRVPGRARHPPRQPHALDRPGARRPRAPPCPRPTTSTRSTPIRCAASTPRRAPRMVDEVDDARKDGDTLGGIVEVLAYGLPPGLGSHVHWDRRLDGKLAQALMSIQAIKGVEVGDGFLTTTRRRGSAAHDELFVADDGITRSSDKAGGTEGGMSTGTVLRVRAGMKPIATVPQALRTVDVATGDTASAHHQRSDVCAVPGGGRRRRGDGRDRPGRGRAREVRRRQRRRDAPQPRVATSRRSRTRCAARPGATPASPSMTSHSDARRADRPDGRRQDEHRTTVAQRARACPSSTPTSRSCATTDPSRSSSSSTAKRTSVRSSAPPSARASPPAASSRSAAGRCWIPTPAPSSPRTASCSSPSSPRVVAGRVRDSNRPLLQGGDDADRALDARSSRSAGPCTKSSPTSPSTRRRGPLQRRRRRHRRVGARDTEHARPTERHADEHEMTRRPTHASP